MLSVAAARQPQLSSAQGSSWPKSQIPNPFPGISAVTAGRGSRARASLARHEVLLQLQHHTFGSHVGWKCPEGHMGSVAPRDTWDQWDSGTKGHLDQWDSGTKRHLDQWDQWHQETCGISGTVAPRDIWDQWHQGTRGIRGTMACAITPVLAMACPRSPA